MTTVEILKTLCRAPGVSGYETKTAEAIKKILSPVCDDIYMSPLGSLIAVKNPGKGKNMILSAHMDKIGFRVTGIDKYSAFLRIASSGGTDPRTLAAARVTVDGAKPLPGVIISTPPHLASSEYANKALPVNELTVDCGLSYEEIIKSVSEGDCVRFDYPFTMLNGNRFTSPYADNCAGCTAVILAMQQLSVADPGCTVTAVFSTREETGKQGAASGIFSVGANEAIVIDASFGDSPGMPSGCVSPLGSGAMICRSPVLQDDMSRELCTLAKKENIPYTVETEGRTTGTDADVIVTVGGGIRTALVSVPVKYMHTPAETADIRDIENVARLLVKYVSERWKDND